MPIGSLAGSVQRLLDCGDDIPDFVFRLTHLVISPVRFKTAEAQILHQT